MTAVAIVAIQRDYDAWDGISQFDKKVESTVREIDTAPNYFCIAFMDQNTTESRGGVFFQARMKTRIVSHSNKRLLKITTKSDGWLFHNDPHIVVRSCCGAGGDILATRLQAHLQKNGISAEIGD